MSLLLEYLNNLKVPSDVDFNKFLEEHFLEKFGVMVKNEGDLFLMKYNQLSAKWDQKITHECRGIILRYGKEYGTWQIVSRPFDKFFNLHEFYCPINKEDQFKELYPKIKISQKADGSCIQVWWDVALNKWRASTLGTITPGQVQDNTNLTFDQLFWNTLKIDADVFDLIAIKGLTYLFELCCEDNRIVTKYPSDCIFFLGIRSNESGKMMPQDTVDEMALNLRVKVPYYNTLKELGLDTIQKLKDWVEEQSRVMDYGEFPEGFVASINNIPIAKIKNSKYLVLHDAGGGDPKHTRNVIIDAIFNGHFDDIAPVLTVKNQEFATNVFNKFHELQKIINKCINDANGVKFATRKDYALWVQGNVPKNLQGFFFKNQNQLNIELFDEWIKKHYLGFEDYWKDNA